MAFAFIKSIIAFFSRSEGRVLTPTTMTLPVNPIADFSTDRPLTDHQEDRLNRTAFAERIADVLLNLPRGSSLTVGIHGPWGDGKTTVLNFIRSRLEASPTTVVVQFNPWRFTDESAMLAEFFRYLAATIRAKLTTRGEDIAGWIEKVGIFAAVVSDRFGAASEVAGKHADVGLEEVRRRLFEVLAEADRKIVVLDDDIDRLDKHESHTLFRLIKACADFPNVCYVLAFDDAAVAKALGERYGAGDEAAGRAFLEKIIQIPLSLPVAAREDLRSICFNQVDAALKQAGIELTQEQVGEFIAGFDKGPSIRLTTPRAAKRYGNGLMFALPMLKGETNPVDLLLVEALRAFFPEVYQVVQNEHTAFSGVESERRSRREENPRSMVLLKPVLDSMPPDHAEAAKALLIDLFPRLSGVIGHSTYGDDWLGRWERERRVSSPEYAPRYFTYAIPSSDVADATIAALLESASAGNEGVLTATLKTHLSGRKAGRVVEKLRNVETTVDPKAAETLAMSIATLGGQLPNPPALFDFAEPPAQAAILISHLLRRLPAERRLEAARAVARAADPLWFAVECVRWLYVTDKPDKQDSNTLTATETDEVRRVVVDRIKARAAAGDVLFDPDVHQQKSLLFEWWRADGSGPVQVYLETLFARDPAQIARFLRAFAPRAWSEGDVLPHVAELGGDQLKNIKLLIDLDKMAALIRKHCSGDFDNPQWYRSDRPLEQRLAEQFMFVYNKWKSEGEPPDEGRRAEGGEAVGET
jgi:predicted KAP-like P-loop ATPase